MYDSINTSMNLCIDAILEFHSLFQPYSSVYRTHFILFLIPNLWFLSFKHKLFDTSFTDTYLQISMIIIEYNLNILNIYTATSEYSSTTIIILIYCINYHYLSMSLSTTIDINNLRNNIHTLEFLIADKLNNTSHRNIRCIKLSSFDELDTSLYRGINHNNRILCTRKFTERTTPSLPLIPYPNQPSVSTILEDIKGMGLNTVRINMFWEAYRWYKSQGQASTFIDRLKEIASKADELRLGIIYSVMHQWKISSWIYSSSSLTNRGAGFPHECLQALNIPMNSYYDQSITVNNVTTTVRNYFWSNFINNYNVTIDNTTKPVWQHIWDDYYRDVVITTKDYRSTIGYEMLNEPLEGYQNFTLTEWQKLGDYYSFMANKIRSITNKKIFFAELLAFSGTYSGKGRGYAVSLTIPQDTNGNIINNIVFTMNRYGNEGFSSNTIGAFNDIQNTLQPLNIPIVITEFNNRSDLNIELTYNGLVNYLTEMKKRGFGWFFFNYDPNFPWTIKDSNYNDRWNSSRTVTFKQMLIGTRRDVY